MAAPKQRRALTTQAVQVGSVKTGKFGKSIGAVTGRTASGSRVGATDAAIKAGSSAYGRSSPTTGIGGGGRGGVADGSGSEVVANTSYAGGTTIAPGSINTRPTTTKPPTAPTPTASSSSLATARTVSAGTTAARTATTAKTTTAKTTTAKKPTATATKVGTHSLSEVRRYTTPKGTVGTTVVKTAGGGSAKRAGGPAGKPVAKKAKPAKRVAKVARKTPPKGNRKAAAKKPVAKKLTKQQMARRFG